MDIAPATRNFDHRYSLIDEKENRGSRVIKHRRYSQIAGISACMESALDFTEMNMKKQERLFSNWKSL